MQVGFYSFTPIEGLCDSNLGLSRKDAETLVRNNRRAMNLTENDAENLKAIRSILEECIKRGASFDEFKTLVKERFNNEL